MVSGPGESAAGVTYLSMRKNPKSCRIFPLKIETSFLKASRKSTFGGVFNIYKVKVGIEAIC